MPSARVVRLVIFLFILVAVLSVTFFREALTRHTKDFIWKSQANHEFDGVQSGNMNVADAPTPAYVYQSNGLLERNPSGYRNINDQANLWKRPLRNTGGDTEDTTERWKYVEDNNVQLPDEYDQIWKDLEVFWGYHPSDLQRLQLQQESFNDSYTIGKDSTGEVSVVKMSFADPDHPNRLRGAEEY
ncbi:hypothetical protein BDQ17DRAFT_1424430 [Cyathus striatus]|nr:hypothetical protein BDQ17DRAFT_1424430 [Cyathus striatus]